MTSSDAEADEGQREIGSETSRPVDPSDWTHGRVIRLLQASPRIVRERFWLDLAHEHQKWRWTIENELKAHPELIVLGEHSFVGQPPLGPITLSERRLPPGLSDEQYTDQVVGNLAPVEDPIVPPPLETIDASETEPLPDEEAWAWLERLGGKPTYAAIDRVAVELSREDETIILGMEQAGMRLMEALDRPDLDAVWTDDEGRLCAPPLLDRWRRGAILAGGRDVYRAALRDGASAEHHPPSDGSWAVAHLGSSALHKRLGRQVLVSTRWSPSDGSNTTAWQGLIANTRPVPRAPEEVERLEAEERERRRIWMTATGEDIRVSRQWFTIRFLVVVGDGAVELVQYVSDPTGDPLAAGTAAADRAASELGGRRIGPVEVYNPHRGHPLSGDVFVIKRRFSRGVEAYRKRYRL